MNIIKYLSLVLTFIFLVNPGFAASMTTPEARLEIFSKDGFPIEGVAMSGMLGFSALTSEDCSGWICIPSLPYFKNKSEIGQVLGLSDYNGTLVVEQKEWITKNLTAKDLHVHFFVNGTKNVECDIYGQTSEPRFVDVIPQWLNGKLYEREYECSSLDYKENSRKAVYFKCVSPFTLEEIDNKISAAKSTCK